MLVITSICYTVGCGSYMGAYVTARSTWNLGIGMMMRPRMQCWVQVWREYLRLQVCLIRFNSVTYLNQTPIFECGCGLVRFQGRMPKGGICYVQKEVGLCVQYMIIINSSIRNNIIDWDLYSYSMSTIIFVLIKNMIFK